MSAAWRGRIVSAPLAALVLAVLALILVPIGVTLLMSVWSMPFGSPGGVLTLGHYVAAATDPKALPLMGNTLVLTIAAGTAATLLGLLLAWIVTSTDVPFRRVLYVLPMLPLLLPLLLKTTALIILYSPRIGLVNVALKELLGTPTPVFDIYSMHGMIFALTLGTTPMAYLVLIPALSSMNRSLEEASRVAGAGRIETLVRVVIPAVTPGVLSALALSALLVATAFETPILLGLPGGVRTYMSAIYQSIQSGGVPNYSLAAAQSAVFLALSLLLLGWYLRATRSERRFAVVSGRGYARGRTQVGPWRWLLLAIVVAYFLLAFAQLAVVTVLVSLVPFYTVVSGNPFQDLTTETYRTALTSTVIRAITTSLALSAVVAVGATAIGIVLSVVALKTELRFRRLVEVIATLPVALPPMVFSVALLMTVLFVPGLKIAYNTPLPMVIADIVVFLPFGMRILSGALVQIGDELLEAARVSGGTWLQSVRTVILPLLGLAITNMLVLTFVLSMRELGAVVLLVTPNIMLLPSLIFGMVETGQFQLATVLNVFSAVIPLIVVAVVFAVRWVVPRAGRAIARRAWSAAPSTTTPLRGIGG